MKRYIAFFIAALCCGVAMTGCDESHNEYGGSEVDASVVGTWRLDSMNGTAVDGFGVYIEFGANGRFELYQQFSTGYYEKFDGTFSASAGRLTGSYSDGEALNTYDYSTGNDGRTLILVTLDENPVESVYVRSDIPADLLPAPIARSGAAVVRAL